MICNHHLHVYPNLLRTRLTKGTAAGHKKNAKAAFASTFNTVPPADMPDSMPSPYRTV